MPEVGNMKRYCHRDSDPFIGGTKP